MGTETAVSISLPYGYFMFTSANSDGEGWNNWIFKPYQARWVLRAWKHLGWVFSGTLSSFFSNYYCRLGGGVQKIATVLGGNQRRRLCPMQEVVEVVIVWRWRGSSWPEGCHVDALQKLILGWGLFRSCHPMVATSFNPTTTDRWANIFLRFGFQEPLPNLLIVVIA